MAHGSGHRRTGTIAYHIPHRFAELRPRGRVAACTPCVSLLGTVCMSMRQRQGCYINSLDFHLYCLPAPAPTASALARFDERLGRAAPEAAASPFVGSNPRVCSSDATPLVP